MKKMLLILTLLLFFPGCAGVETFETLPPGVHEAGPAPEPGQIQLALPQDTTATVFENGKDQLYLWRDLAVLTQILDAGDIVATVQSLSGFKPDQLTLLQSNHGDMNRYDWVWSAASDDGELVCRSAVLDDGTYHYCLTVLAPAQTSAEYFQQISDIFASFEVD